MFIRVQGEKWRNGSKLYAWSEKPDGFTVWRKTFEGENVRVFRGVRTIRESFSATFCGHTHIIIGRTGAIRKNFLCEILVLNRNAKLFSPENFPLYGNSVYSYVRTRYSTRVIVLKPHPLWVGREGYEVV